MEKVIYNLNPEKIKP